MTNTYDDRLMADCAAYIRSLLHYNPSTGVLTWRVNRRSRGVAGSVAGSLNKAGYRYIGIDGRKYMASHIAHLIRVGRFPDLGMEVDHRNLKRDDNRWSNLREVTHAQNLMNTGARINNSSGYRGVSMCKADMWRAVIKADHQRYHLGTFSTAEEAADAYRSASKELHGRFRRIERRELVNA